ncbi:MAG: lipid II flippase MurJ [Candidatus Zixiibacteriota bacterium]
MTERLTKQTLVAATLVTVGGNVLGRLFGYLREAVTADYFGTSAALDIFLIAFIIPEIMTFVIFAALPTTVIQTVSAVGRQERNRENSLFWNGFYAIGGILLLVTSSLILARHEIIGWSAGELSPEAAVSAARLLGILALVVLFRGLEAYFRAWLFHRKHFVAPALSPIVLDLVLIGWILLGYDALQIDTLAYGWLSASVLLLVMHVVMAIRVVRPGRPAGQGDAAIAPLLKMTMIVAAIEATSLLYPAIDRFLAVRYLGDGEIAALRYALFLAMVPPGMLVVTFAAASFPWIADMAANQPERLKSFYQETIRLVLYVLAPLVAAMIVFAPEVVSVAFRRGEFDQYSVGLTAGPLLCYSLGLIFYGLYFYRIRYYYAKRLLTQLGFTLGLTLMLKLIASVALVRWLGANGLALATSLAWLATSMIMTKDLARRAGLTLADDTRRWLFRLLVAAAGTVLVWLAARQIWPAPLASGLTAQFVWLIVVGIVGLAVYVASSFALKLPEPTRLFETIRNRIETRRSGSEHESLG